ncbi:MAG: tetratricopeptide repeat protein [bacterium]|nr:tetratricopeptide repeat protein [bacterium]
MLFVFGTFDTTSSEMMMNYYESTGDFVSALEEAKSLYHNTGDFFYLKKMILYAMRLGNVSDGLKWGFDYLDKEFDHDVFFLIVSKLKEGKDLSEFRDIIKKYSSLNDSLSFYEGYLYYLEGNYEKALPCFERSKSYFSALPVFVSSYLDLLWKLRKTDLLKNYLDSVNTGLPQLKFLRGLYYKLIGLDDSALLIFKGLYKEGLGDIGFLKVYMQSLDEAGKYEEADSVAEKLKKVMPFSSEVRKLLGLHYLNRGDYATALSEFLVASGLQEGDADVHYYLSRTLYALGAIQDALKEIEKAVKLNPYSREYLYYRIFLLLSAGRNDEALRYIYITERNLGEESYLFYLKAEAFKRRDDRENAFRNYLKALELDSLNLKRYIDLLEYAKIAKIGLDFKGYLNRALRVAREGIDSINVAYIAMELREYEFAMNIMEKMVEAGYEDPLLYNNLAYALCELDKDLERAINLVDQSIKAQPDDYHFLDTKAWILFKMGRIDESLKLIEEAIQKGGADDPEVKIHYKLIKGTKGLSNE